MRTAWARPLPAEARAGAAGAGGSTGGSGGATGGAGGSGGVSGSGGTAGAGGSTGGAAGAGGSTGGAGGATGGAGGATGGTGGATGGTGGATGGTGGATGGTGGATGGGSGFWPNAYDANCTPVKSSPNSHSGFQGMECLNCHKQGGVADGKNWMFGGVVWTTSGATAGAPNVEIGVKDGTNFHYACTDSKGLFYVNGAGKTAPTWATAEIRMRSAAGEKTMLSKSVQAGSCNASACHAGSTKLVKP